MNSSAQAALAAAEKDGASAPFSHLRKCAVQILRLSYLDDLKLHTRRTGDNLYRSLRVCAVWIGRTPKDRHARDFWNNLLEQLQIFRAQVH